MYSLLLREVYALLIVIQSPTSMNQNKYDYILTLCKSWAIKFERPFTIEGDEDHVYSTNSFLVIRMAKKLPAKIYEPMEGVASVPTVFNLDASVPVEQIHIQTNELLGLLSSHDMHLDNNMKCVECGGTGESECWHCHHDAECEECNGSGKNLSNTRPLRRVQFKKNTITLNGVDFTCEYLHIVALIAMAVGRAYLTLDVRATKAHIQFTDDIEMMLMTCNRKSTS